jgi:hypothetical protein
MPIARQRLGKHIPATHANAIRPPLLGNGPVNNTGVFFLGSVSRGYKGSKKVAGEMEIVEAENSSWVKWSVEFRDPSLLEAEELGPE